MYKLLLLLLAVPVYLFAQPNKNQLAERVDAYMANYLSNKDFAGTVLIVKGVEILFERAYGFADAARLLPNAMTTQFRISSITKTFTAAMFLMCRDKGLVNLEDPLSKYIPEYPNGNKIKIRHLLNHESGIPNYNEFADYDAMMAVPHSAEEMVDWFKDKPLQFKPGKDGAYTNSGYTLLALLLEKITGKSYAQNLRELIITPLELQHTGLDFLGRKSDAKAYGHVPLDVQAIQPAKDYYIENKIGSGNLYSTALEMYVWTRAVMHSKLYPFNKKNGFGWAIRNYFDHDLIEQDGQSPGYISYISYYPKDDLYIIYLGNVEAMGFRKLRLDLAAIYFGAPYYPPAIRQNTTFDKKLLEHLSGQYAFSPAYKFVISREQDRLYFHWLNRSSREELIPLNATEVTLRSSGVVMTLQNLGLASQNIKWNENGYVAVCPKEK